MRIIQSLAFVVLLVVPAFAEKPVPMFPPCPIGHLLEYEARYRDLRKAPPLGCTVLWFRKEGGLWVVGWEVSGDSNEALDEGVFLDIQYWPYLAFEVPFSEWKAYRAR